MISYRIDNGAVFSFERGELTADAVNFVFQLHHAVNLNSGVYTIPYSFCTVFISVFISNRIRHRLRVKGGPMHG